MRRIVEKLTSAKWRERIGTMSTSVSTVLDDSENPFRRGTNVPISQIKHELEEAFAAGSRKHGFSWRRWCNEKTYTWTKTVLKRYDLVLVSTYTHSSGTCLHCGWGTSIQDVGVLVPSTWGGLETIDLLCRYRTCGC